MTNTDKIYIGKGKQVKDLDLYSIVINLSAAQAQTFTSKNGDTLLRLSFAKTKNPDMYGNTHTAYVQPTIKKQVEEPAPAQAKTKRTKKIEPSFTNH